MIGGNGIEAMRAGFLEGRWTPMDVVEQTRQLVETWNPLTRAVIRAEWDRAFKAAEESWARYRQGRPLSALDGIPVGLKDLIDAAGIITTAGSAILAEHVADRNAVVVDRLLAAGANPYVLKLNMHEFAYGPTSASSFFGPVTNPYRADYMAGGSSGGSAVAVATNMVPVALGTDTGGSIRIPAAFCGISGLKPTYGRVSRDGVIPLAWSLDHVGPMAGSVKDLAAVLEHLAESPVGEAPASRRWRLFWPDGEDMGPYDPVVDRAVTEAVQIFADRFGAAVERGPLPELAAIRAAQQVIIGAEAAAYHWHWLRTCPEQYQPDVRERLESRSAYLAVHYIEALRTRNRLIRQYRQWFSAYDAVVTATVPILPPPVDTLTVTTPTGAEEDVRATVVRLTAPFNLLGFPALSIPIGASPEGLPIGLQLAGKPWDEATLLAMGMDFQDATDYHLRRATG